LGKKASNHIKTHSTAISVFFLDRENVILIFRTNIMNYSTASYQTHDDSIDHLFSYIYKSIGLIIYVLSSLGNVISIGIFLTKSWRKNVCVFYLTCYTLSGVFYVNIFILTEIINNISGYSLHKSNDIFCKLYLYSYFLFATLAPNVLIFASIDRFLLSSRNVDARLYSSKRLAYFSLGISSLLWSLYYLHIPINSGIQQISSTEFKCDFDQSQAYLSFVYYSLAGTNIIGCLTIAILVLISLKNIRYFRRMSRQQRTRQVHTMKRKDFQLLRCLCILDIIYTVFSMLSLMYDIFYTFILKDETKLSMEQTIYSFLSRFFTFLTSIPYGSCFMVFFIISKAFRLEVKQLFRKTIG